VRRLEASGIRSGHLAIANEVLAHNISAALGWGISISLRTDIEWIAGLLENHGIPRELLLQYLSTYRDGS